MEVPSSVTILAIPTSISIGMDHACQLALHLSPLEFKLVLIIVIIHAQALQSFIGMALVSLLAVIHYQRE